MAPSAPLRRRAFTLIEVILVLLLIAAMMMLAAPALSGWGQGAKLDDAAGRFVAAARYARSQAIATAMPHRIQIGNTGNRFDLQRQEGTSWITLEGDIAQFTLPTGFTLRAADGATGGAIDFSPSGRTTPATIEFVAPRGFVTTVSCAFSTDLFRVVEGTR